MLGLVHKSDRKRIRLAAASQQAQQKHKLPQVSVHKRSPSPQKDHRLRNALSPAPIPRMNRFRELGI
jgi:hypothetical protein